MLKVQLDLDVELLERLRNLPTDAKQILRDTMARAVSDVIDIYAEQVDIPPADPSDNEGNVNDDD